MEILRGVPDGYLWLLSNASSTEENLRNQAKRLGIEPDRLFFGSRLPYDEYLARFQLADLFLDTLPFNGGTTISDALWAGLPVLTQAGHSFAGRMGASLLNAVNLPELITNSREEYIQKAIEFGNDTNQLLEIKQKLARTLKICPLFNSAQFTKNIESAFLAVYEIYHNKEELKHVFIKN
jgi:predicted O-linked N-acetylglucosamine transferase (SPINDLY family)